MAYVAPSLCARPSMSSAGTLPQRYFFLPYVTILSAGPVTLLTKAGLRCSASQEGRHVVFISSDLQSVLCCFQWLF